MVDFRKSGVSSSRNYSRKSRTKKRSEAMARPGLGQWTPGALSNAPADTSRSVASPIQGHYPFVTQNGESGQLMPQPQQQGFGMSPSFAAKANEQQAMTGLLQPNASNPFQPGFTGTAPDSFSGMMEGGASMMQPEQNVSMMQPGQASQEGGIMDSIRGRVHQDLQATGFGFMIPEQYRNAVEKELEGKLSTGGVTMGAGMLGGSLGKVLKGSMPGTISKASARKGINAKNAQTFSQWAKNFFTLNKVSQTINPRTGKVVKITMSRNPLTALVVGGAVATAALIGYSLVRGGKGEQVMASWANKEELPQMASMYYSKMEKAGDPEAAAEILAIGREAGREAIEFSLIPGKTGMKENQRYFDAWDRIMDVVEVHNETKAELGGDPSMQETGEYWTAYHNNIQEKMTLEEQKRVDYFNSQKLLTEQMIVQSRAEQSLARDKYRTAALQEQAAFWLEYRKKLLKLEEEERIKQAEFWLAYRKTIMKMQAENSRSRLRFGIL